MINSSNNRYFYIGIVSECDQLKYKYGMAFIIIIIIISSSCCIIIIIINIINIITKMYIVFYICYS